MEKQMKMAVMGFLRLHSEVNVKQGEEGVVTQVSTILNVTYRLSNSWIKNRPP